MAGRQRTLDGRSLDRQWLVWLYAGRMNGRKRMNGFGIDFIDFFSNLMCDKCWLALKWRQNSRGLRPYGQ